MSLLNKVVGLEARNFIKNRLRDRCLPVNIAKFLKNSFFCRKPPVAAYMSTRKGKEEESLEQKREKSSNKRRKNESILFNFYLQVLVLVITEMHIQLYQY